MRRALHCTPWTREPRLTRLRGLAARQWKSELYRARGVEVCASIWMHCINKETNMPMLGGWVGGPDDRFGPLKDLAYCDLCRPSDLMLTHYQLFAEARP